MSKIQIENLIYENITLYIVDTSDGIEIAFKGSIDMEYPHFKLDPYFERIHKAILQKKIKYVYCNLQELCYINSSGIRSVIKWILDLTAMKDSDDAYHIIFVISKEYKWQSASFEFIVNLCPELIHIQK
ncbi:MAG: hypothetical protein JXB88_14695 [Spirochaetales bacterium]|nr:hypothetical protein [Spirochaetales bacterium]